MNEERYLRENIICTNKKEQEGLNQLINDFGLDKCIEIYHNLDKLISKEVTFKSFFNFAALDVKLSEILFTLLRHEENHVKAFLCNIFNDYQIQIEERPSNYSKNKYYFKIPIGVNEYLDIRTYNYERGSIDYYDAIKTLDFYDVNLILSHLPTHLINKFSKNPNIIMELDKTRQLRNYVYHHNVLYSLTKENLKSSIILVLKNLPNKDLKSFYIKQINSLKSINEEVKIYIDEYDEEEVYKY